MAYIFIFDKNLQKLYLLMIIYFKKCYSTNREKIKYSKRNICYIKNSINLYSMLYCTQNNIYMYILIELIKVKTVLCYLKVNQNVIL